MSWSRVNPVQVRTASAIAQLNTSQLIQLKLRKSCHTHQYMFFYTPNVCIALQPVKQMGLLRKEPINTYIQGIRAIEHQKGCFPCSPSHYAGGLSFEYIHVNVSLQTIIIIGTNRQGMTCMQTVLFMCYMFPSVTRKFRSL